MDNDDLTTQDRPVDSPKYQERRRPGRVVYDNPALLALLRGTAPPIEIEKAAGRGEEESEGLPARGIAIGVLLSVPLWGIVGGVGWLVFKALRSLF